MLLFKILYNGLVALNESFKRDKRLTGYPFVGAPWPMVITIALYLMLVLKWGPKFMAHRKPYDVDGPMKVYNIIQIVLNSIVFYESLRYSFLRKDYNFTCEKYDPDDTSPMTMKLARPALIFYLTKYLDIFDTIFFLLRKKYNQISFLHVYHHSLMIFGVYVYCTLLFSSHFTATGVINSFIHVCMYTYYLVAALKLNVNLNPWKRTLTRMQLLQFVFLAIHYGTPLINNWCKLTVPWLLVSFLQNMFMIVLFANFYYKTYVLKDRKLKLQRNSSPSTAKEKCN